MRRSLRAFSIGLGLLLLAGCPKGGQQYSAGRKAELAKDWDSAVVEYERALRADPINVEYKLKIARARFEAGQMHVRQGQKLREKGDLEVALAEFQKALAIDPSSPIAEQEVRRTMEMLAARKAATEPPAPPAHEEPKLAAQPPQLAPELPRTPVNLKLTNDARMVYDAVCKLAGITVVFDPDLPARRIAVELPNVTIEDALDIISLQAKALWKPIARNIVFVYPDQQQKRRDFEEQVVRTFYLSNTLTQQDLTEIVTAMRQLVDITRIQQVSSQNAILAKGSPDKIAIIDKYLRDIDRARPEVVVDVAILQIRRDRLRDLGLEPDKLGKVLFTPGGTSSSSSGTSGTTTTTTIPLTRGVGPGDFSYTLPGATANALYTDSTTKVIQNPEIRVLDGESAKLKIGDRVPIATGSFQAGVGVGATTGAIGGIVNPLVNTQFQYLDVGVNLDVTPRIHPNREVSLKLGVEVSSVTGHQSIGGIDQPIISQRKIEPFWIRLKEGEASILGGLIDRTDTKSISGWPGLSKIPFLRYFFSSENVEHEESEVFIIVTPRVVRAATITAENLRSLSAGSETYVQVRHEEPAAAPPTAPPAQQPPPQPQGGAAPATVVPPPAAQQPAPNPAPSQPPAAAAPAPTSTTTAPAPQADAGMAKIRFEPVSLTLKPGETVTMGIVVENVQDLFSLPMLLQFNPAVISIEEVRHGGFMAGGNQEVAVVSRVDKERGQAVISLTRPPNTPGVNGTGTVVGLVIKGVAPGTSGLAILQVNARDSQQKQLRLVTGEASIRVQ